jgi:LytS/YehU family sensor histidine kinase
MTNPTTRARHSNNKAFNLYKEISHMINKLEIEKDRDIDRLMVLRILNDINKEIEFLI